MKKLLERDLLLDTSTAQVCNCCIFAWEITFSSFDLFKADCTLGGWGDWVCQASNGSCGNGTLYHQKIVLLQEQNGGSCEV